MTQTHYRIGDQERILQAAADMARKKGRSAEYVAVLFFGVDWGSEDHEYATAEIQARMGA